MMRPCEEYIVDDPRQLGDILAQLAADPSAPPRTYNRLQGIWARQVGDDIELSYLASAAIGEPFRLWRCRVSPGTEVPSLSPIVALAGSYEREVRDLYGIDFAGALDRRSLIFHHAKARGAPSRDQQVPIAPSAPTIVESPDLQLLRFGPVRADVVESARFAFSYAGEGIIHLETQFFYKYRGMEKRFEGATPTMGSILAERVSGVDSVAHAFAFALACERAVGIEVPERAQQLRVLLAELERIYNHLHYFGLLAKLTTLKVGEAEGHYLEELAKQANASLTDSRFLRGLITPGGLRKDLDVSALEPMLTDLEERVQGYLGTLNGTRSYLDRIETTGVLETHVALAQGATGPIERASGLDRDLRRDHPYGGYDRYQFVVPDASAGDARARALIREEELFASFAIVQQILKRLDHGPIQVPFEAASLTGEAEGLGWVEGTRGTLIYAVYLEDGRLTRVKIKEPSFSNWRVFPYTVDGTNMMDYAINEASFGLSLAGNDR
jgi:Ni,Fe-hydrogenase III large subunit